MENLIFELTSLGFKVESYSKQLSGKIWVEQLKFNHPTHKPYLTVKRTSCVGNGEFNGKYPYTMTHQKVNYSKSSYYKKFNQKFTSERNFIKWVKNFIADINRLESTIMGLASDVIGDSAKYYVLVDNPYAYSGETVAKIILFGKNLSDDNYYFKNRFESTPQNQLDVIRLNDTFSFTLSLANRSLNLEDAKLFFKNFELTTGKINVKSGFKTRAKSDYNLFGYPLTTFNYQFNHPNLDTKKLVEKTNVEPIIGQRFEGGFYTGDIIDDGVIYHLVVAPSGVGRNNDVGIPWKTTNDTAPEATRTLTNGLAATLAMVNENEKAGKIIYPAAQYCYDLDIDDYKDWYLPARDELEVAYRNLKPTTNGNSMITRSSIYYCTTGFGVDGKGNGYNSNSNPTGDAYTTSVPAQTDVSAFQAGGSTAFVTSYNYWSATEFSSANAWFQDFYNGFQSNTSKTFSLYVCAFRRVRAKNQIKVG